MLSYELLRNTNSTHESRIASVVKRTYCVWDTLQHTYQFRTKFIEYPIERVSIPIDLELSSKFLGNPAALWNCDL